MNANSKNLLFFVTVGHTCKNASLVAKHAQSQICQIKDAQEAPLVTYNYTEEAFNIIIL